MKSPNALNIFYIKLPGLSYVTPLSHAVILYNSNNTNQPFQPTEHTQYMMYTHLCRVDFLCHILQLLRISFTVALVKALTVCVCGAGLANWHANYQENGGYAFFFYFEEKKN